MTNAAAPAATLSGCRGSLNATAARISSRKVAPSDLRPHRLVGLVEELGVEKLREARVVAENLRVDGGRHLVDPSQERLRAPYALSVGGEVGEVAGDALVAGDAHQRLAHHLGHLRVDVGTRAAP